MFFQYLIHNKVISFVNCVLFLCVFVVLFFFQAEDGIRDLYVTGVQTCALPICDDAHEEENGRPAGRGQRSRTRQWRKWRRPVKAIAAPAAATASMTSSSRREPPGWTIAAIPASSASCGPSANGKKASEASTAPAGSCPN